VLEATPIGPNVPSLQSQVRFTQYQVEVKTDKKEEEIKISLDTLLSLESLPWHHERDTGRKSYDLRNLIDDIWLVEMKPSACVLGMILRCDDPVPGGPSRWRWRWDFREYPAAIQRTKLLLGSHR